jgi:hypothetical protein
MQPKKSHLDQFERTLSVFGVQPDWYEDYWLRPKKASRPIGRRWRGSNLFQRSILQRSILCAAIISMFVYFGRWS